MEADNLPPKRRAADLRTQSTGRELFALPSQTKKSRYTFAMQKFLETSQQWLGRWQTNN